MLSKETCCVASVGVFINWVDNVNRPDSKADVLSVSPLSELLRRRANARTSASECIKDIHVLALAQCNLVTTKQIIKTN